MLFSMLEIQKAYKAYFNISTPSPNHITWQYLKLILANNIYAINIFSLVNICLSLQNWPRNFKKSIFVIIPKLSKPAYDTSMVFRSIVLPNILNKLIKKITARQLKFYAVKYCNLHFN